MRYCANQRGISLSQIIFELVGKKACRVRENRARHAEDIAGLDALVKATHGWIDEPYESNCADAYEHV